MFRNKSLGGNWRKQAPQVIMKPQEKGKVDWRVTRKSVGNPQSDVSTDRHSTESSVELFMPRNIVEAWASKRSPKVEELHATARNQTNNHHRHHGHHRHNSDNTQLNPSAEFNYAPRRITESKHCATELHKLSVNSIIRSTIATILWHLHHE